MADNKKLKKRIISVFLAIIVLVGMLTFAGINLFAAINNTLENPKLVSVSNAATGIKVTWEKVNGAEKYRVFYKANGESTWHRAGNTASTSLTWTGAESGTKYTFTVRCIDKDGKNYTSSYDSIGKSINYIAAPKISAISNTATGVKITWGKVTGAAKYRVFYKANGESTWHRAGNTASTSFIWTGAKSGTKYTFTVRCIDKDGNKYTSSYDNAGKSIVYIAAPKLSSVANAATGVKVTWGKVTGAVRYRVFYKKNGETTWHKAGDTTATSYTWTGAKSNTKYTFTVRCINAGGTAYTGSYDNTGKSLTYIAAPKNISAINVSTGTLISWDKVSGAAKYRVFYKANGESTWHKAGDTTSTVLTWKNAKSGVKYTFTVRCMDKSGNYISSYDNAGKAVSTTFTTSKGYKGEVKNGIVYIEGYLIANKTYPLPKSYGDGITSTAQAAFNKMKEGAKKDGLTLTIASGYRSYSYQNTIYNNYCKRDGKKEADTYSARPGHSEHQSGLAMDLNRVGNSFTGSKEAKWLEKNCYKYGFILRYPQGKTNETGYVYESWHFRYVGEDLAKKLYNGGNWITMEDYFGITSEYC